jgi:O-antigen/teichoic acid export membrane protein
LGMSRLFLLLISCVWFYTREYKYYAPSFKFVKFSFAKNIMNLGLRFFLIQISVLVLFSTDNMIITQLFGPEMVVPYNIAYKYFSVTNMVFSIIISPYWSGITDAYTKQDLPWIKNSMRNLIRLTVPFFFLIIGMVFISNFVYHYWVGSKIQVPISLSIFMGVYWMICIFITPFTFFINGTGKIQIQLILCVVGALVNIPISILLAKYLGVKGVILGTTICLLPGSVLVPIQYYKIINKNAFGIWNK